MSDQINQDNKIPEKKYRRFFKSTAAKVIMSVVLILFAVLTIKGIALARHLHKFHDDPHGFIMDQIVEKLNLDANQKAQVERIRDQIKEKMDANKPDRQNGMDEFENEFKKDNIDKNTLKQLMEKKDQKREEMKDFMLDRLIEFHNILTPDQREKAAGLMKDMRGKFHEKMEDRGPGRPDNKND